MSSASLWIVWGGFSTKKSWIAERIEPKRSARGGGNESFPCGAEEWGCESGTRSVDGEELAGTSARGELWGAPGAAFSLLLLSGGVELTSVVGGIGGRAKACELMEPGSLGIGNTLYTI